VKVTGAINAEEIDIGGKIQADSIKCERMRVGGRADIQNGFEASSVDVGGKVLALGTVKLVDLHVGGEAEVGGGFITGNIRVGGKFISKSSLEFGELLIYGRGFLPAGCKGHRVSTFGKLDVDGNITCDYFEVAGFIAVKGDCNAEHVEVSGKFEVSGALTASDKLEGFGSTDVGGNFESAHIRVSGKFNANKMLIKEKADISGKLETKEGLKAKLVIVRSGSQCKGVLIGEQVEVGKSSDLIYGGLGVNWATKWAAAGATSRVGDIYARQVVIGPMSRAGRIFADTVKLEKGSAVEQVTYINELKVDLGAAVGEAPKKVDILPKSPF
jgi:cytoskeletal protein CcmA (bactofilin family)